jgi:DNA-binding response OmpR family regulator
MGAVRQAPLILICDDDAVARELIATTLRSEQFEVIVADNGADAVRLAAVHRPDLVLLDFLMPGQLSGLDTLRDLADRGLAPVAMLSTLDDYRDRITASRRGAIAFLNKADDLEGLGAQVRKVLADCARRAIPRR